MNAVNAIRGQGRGNESHLRHGSIFCQRYGACSQRGTAEMLRWGLRLLRPETTGLSAANDRITEMARCGYTTGEITDVFNTFVNPEQDYPGENHGAGQGSTTVWSSTHPKEKEAVKASFRNSAAPIRFCWPITRRLIPFIQAVATRHNLDLYQYLSGYGAHVPHHAARH